MILESEIMSWADRALKTLERIAAAQEKLAEFATEANAERMKFKEAREAMAKNIHEMLLKPPLEDK